MKSVSASSVRGSYFALRRGKCTESACGVWARLRSCHSELGMLAESANSGAIAAKLWRPLEVQGAETHTTATCGSQKLELLLAFAAYKTTGFGMCSHAYLEFPLQRSAARYPET